MGQKKVEVEGPGLIEHLCRRKQGGAFLAIGSSLIPFPQIKEEFGRSAGLSHLVLLLLETCVPASRVHEAIPLCQAFFNLASTMAPCCGATCLRASRWWW